MHCSAPAAHRGQLGWGPAGRGNIALLPLIACARTSSVNITTTCRSGQGPCMESRAQSFTVQCVESSACKCRFNMQATIAPATWQKRALLATAICTPDSVYDTVGGQFAIHMSNAAHTHEFKMILNNILTRSCIQARARHVARCRITYVSRATCGMTWRTQAGRHMDWQQRLYGRGPSLRGWTIAVSIS